MRPTQNSRTRKFLISLMDNDKHKVQVKTHFRRYPFHIERLKLLKPELVDVILADDPAPERKKLRCYRCNRSEDVVKMLRCRSCGTPFCVDHNYYNGHCSIMCAK